MRGASRARGLGQLELAELPQFERWQVLNLGRLASHWRCSTRGGSGYTPGRGPGNPLCESALLGLRGRDIDEGDGMRMLLRAIMDTDKSNQALQEGRMQEALEV